MSDFKITEDKLPFIASELGAYPDSVAAFFPKFSEFYEEVRNQHLASVMRALELHVRRKLDKPFTVEWARSATNAPSAGFRWEWGYIIVIPKDLIDMHQIRNIIAHELGHLFYAVEHPRNIKDKSLNQVMANVFGVFTMLERSEFYINKAPKIPHSVWTQIVKDFKHQIFA
jgi:predicted SprT family Zn-dependent metalloprotease